MPSIVIEEVVQKFGIGSNHCRTHWTSSELADKLSTRNQDGIGVTYIEGDSSAWSARVDRSVAEYEVREGAQVCD